MEITELMFEFPAGRFGRSHLKEFSRRPRMRRSVLLKTDDCLMTDSFLYNAKNMYRITRTRATPSATVRAYFGLRVLLTSGIRSEAAT